MQTEALGGSTYKITLDKTEAKEVPVCGSSYEMNEFIRSMIKRLDDECKLRIPNGRLLVEAFMRSDGSCVFFISPLESSKQNTQLFACDLSGVDNLRRLCRALTVNGAECGIYCGSSPDSYRIIFSDPDSIIRHICSEFGDYCEITPLFAAQTREYLTEIAAAEAAEFINKLF